MTQKQIDHRVKSPSHYSPGGTKFLNVVGLTGTVKWKPDLRHFKTGMPYSCNLLDFSTTDTELNAEKRLRFNECEIEIHGDRAVVFAKNIILHDKIQIFGSLKNGRGMDSLEMVYIMVNSFHWLGNMAKYMAKHNELAERRSEHYQILRQISEEERGG